MYHNAFYVVSSAAVFFLLAAAVLFGKLMYTKKQLLDMAEALEEISAGNGNMKILACRNDLTAPLAYKINHIVSGYESRIAAMIRLDEANKQLMTCLSHDVRTPLTTLIGYLDAIHRELVTGRERDSYMETARKKAHALKEYIDVLFEWFKLNSDDFALEMAATEAAEFTRNILKDWIPVFEENDMEFNIDFPEGPCKIKTDKVGYSRVVNNLIQNVIIHSHASCIAVTMKKLNGKVRLCISDNGIGISKEDLPHIFDRLYKCDSSRSAKGSGLGLAITQQLVRKMGGSISADSIPGKETAFTIEFPASS